MARTAAPGIQPNEVQDSTYVFAVDGEASDSYVITLSPAPDAYSDGQIFVFKANTANTGAASLNVNGLGAVTIKKRTGTDLADNDIAAGSIVTVSYDGTNFQMLSMLANAPSGGGDVTKVGVPLDNQVGVWTGNGTIEGDINLTFDTTTDTLETPNIALDKMVFTPDASVVTHSEGQVFYDDNEKALMFDNDEADVRMAIGQELWIPLVRNETGSTITDGQVVFINGATGQNATIALARSDVRSTAEVVGVATHDIENLTNGYVTAFGTVRNQDTSAWADGDVLWVDDTTAGALTNVKPTGTNYVVEVGIVEFSHVSLGKIFVNPTRPLDTTDIVGAQIEPVEGAFVDGDKTKLDGIATSANNYSHPNHTGDVTSTGDGATVIADEAVTNAKLAHVATDTFKGRTTAATGDVEDLTVAQAKTMLDLTGTNSGDEVAASTTVAGVVELATIAETNTGTDTTRALTSDGLQGSFRNLRFIDFIVVDPATDVATGTGLVTWSAPFAGTIVQDDTDVDYFAAYTTTAGTTGTMVVDIHKNGTTIMTTNKLDIETTELDTTLAATQPDLTTTTFVAGDVFTIDIDAVHTTAAKGLVVRMAVRPD